MEANQKILLPKKQEEKMSLYCSHSHCNRVVISSTTEEGRELLNHIQKKIGNKSYTARCDDHKIEDQKNRIIHRGFGYVIYEK